MGEVPLYTSQLILSGGAYEAQVNLLWTPANLASFGALRAQTPTQPALVPASCARALDLAGSICTPASDLQEGGFSVVRCEETVRQTRGDMVHCLFEPPRWLEPKALFAAALPPTHGG